jgi:hypothetical protein
VYGSKIANLEETFPFRAIEIYKILRISALLLNKGRKWILRHAKYLEIASSYPLFPCIKGFDGHPRPGLRTPLGEQQLELIKLKNFLIRVARIGNSLGIYKIEELKILQIFQFKHA